MNLFISYTRIKDKMDIGCAFRRLRGHDGCGTKHQRHDQDRRANPPHAVGERAARSVRPLSITACSQRHVSPHHVAERSIDEQLEPDLATRTLAGFGVPR
jgi:hypothetical protein